MPQYNLPKNGKIIFRKYIFLGMPVDMQHMYLNMGYPIFRLEKGSFTITRFKFQKVK